MGEIFLKTKETFGSTRAILFFGIFLLLLLLSLAELLISSRDFRALKKWARSGYAWLYGSLWVAWLRLSALMGFRCRYCEKKTLEVRWREVFIPDPVIQWEQGTSLPFNYGIEEGTVCRNCD